MNGSPPPGFVGVDRNSNHTNTAPSNARPFRNDLIIPAKGVSTSHERTKRAFDAPFQASKRTERHDFAPFTNFQGGPNIGNAVSPYGRHEKASLLPHISSLLQFDNEGYRDPEFNHPTMDEVHPTKERKFSNFSRLYIGNLPRGTTEQEIRDLFKEFCGDEKLEVFLDASKGFGFVKLPHRHQALAAKEKLDNTVVKHRHIRVRFGKHSGALVVKNLGPLVSNEMLHRAFREFGELEKAVVLTDEMNRSTGEGKIYFIHKHRAIEAMRRVNEGVFCLGSSPRPIICEEMRHFDEEDGLIEATIHRSQVFHRETKTSPRFAVPGTPEYLVGARWKTMYLNYQKEKEDLIKNFEQNCMIMEEQLEKTLEEMKVVRMREDIERQRKEMMLLDERLCQRLEDRNFKVTHKNAMDVHDRRDEEMRNFSLGQMQGFVGKK